MVHTHTHTYFWSDDQIAALEVEVERLAADWAERKPHIPADMAQRGDRRVMLLRSALAVAREPAD